tara:strand:- start:476 stop:910 length:435 start_codon:yes stop_codon:yes gene_type:complete
LKLKIEVEKNFSIILIHMKNILRSQRKGEKRLFLTFGILNFLITNLVLQILLFLIPTLFATALSQIVNILIGYFLYGKKVFKLKELNKFVFRKYLVLALILWMLNFFLIQSFFYLGVNKNIIAICVIPLLVSISYLSQRNFVFK